MISIYKKYHIAYWCIGVFLIICMIAVMFLFWKEKWYFPLLVLIPTILLVVVNAIVFTRLATKKLSDEVIVLINECQANNYINTLKSLFENKAKGPVVNTYNMLLADGYAVIDDYDSVYYCCQNMKSKAYMPARCNFMIGYYLKKEQRALAENEMEELRKILATIKNQNYKERFETSLKNAEYSIRIMDGNYDGAEEHYKKMLATIKPLYPLTEVSYSYALGKLLILKGEPEKAKEYLNVACEKGGDTKFRKFAEEKLKMLAENKE